MAYNFGNAMISDLLGRQQNALAYSPSGAAGRALSAVPAVQFKNPWATFLTSLGTNLLGSGLTSYAALNNQNETNALQQQLATIMTDNTNPQTQEQLLKSSEGLSFLSKYPALIAQQEAKDYQDKVGTALLGQGITIQNGEAASIPKVEEILNRRAANQAAIQNQVSEKQLLQQLQSGVEGSPYLKEMQQLAPRINQMTGSLGSQDPNADLVFLAGAREALGQFKDDKESWGQFDVLRKLFTEPEKLSTLDKQSLTNIATQRYGMLDQQHQNLIAGAQGQAGTYAPKLRMPTAPLITRQEGQSGGLPLTAINQGNQTAQDILSSKQKNFSGKVILKTPQGIIKVSPNDPRVKLAKKQAKR